MKNLSKFLGLLTLLTVSSILFGSGKAHAATITVGSGCTIADAIDSVNAGSDQASCGGTSYGTNDIISIPAGTITLVADLPTIIEPVTIQGAGMGSTTISGDAGQYKAFFADGSFLVTIKDLKITAFKQFAILTYANNLTIDNVEIDGTGAQSTGELGGIVASNNDGITNTIDINHTYVHSLTDDGNIIQGISIVNGAGGAVTNALIQNSTVSGLSNGIGSVNAFLLSIGTYGGLTPGNGTVNGTINNVTVENNSSASQSVAGFGGFAMALGGNSIINMAVTNITSTGLTGFSSQYGSAAAFFAGGAGIGAGDIGTTNLSVRNSLMADNLANGTPNNCAVLDITSAFSGAGTGVGNITSLGNNISDDATCTSFTQSGDRQNVGNIIATLGSLQNNGGVVPTRALLPGSPAIAAGSAVLGVATDARGIARPSTPDVGAYQTVLGASSTTPSTNFAGVSVPNTGFDKSLETFSVVRFQEVVVALLFALFTVRKLKRAL